jgi:RNA polymerase sigma factor (sigma-70 family)
MQSPPRGGDPIVPLTDEQQRIVEENIPLIYYVANRYRHVPEAVFQDLTSRLYLRLCICVQRFDPSRKNTFSSYAVSCFNGEIKNYFRDESWIIRPPRPLREISFSQAVDSLGDDLSAAELRGENPQTVGSCAIPVPLHSVTSSMREDDDYELDPPSDEDIEQTITDQHSWRIIWKEIFLALRPEERMILCLQMKGKSFREVEQRFHISRADAQAVWDELQKKVKRIYFCVLEGDPVPASTGNMALKRALKRRFTSDSPNFLEVRRRITSDEEVIEEAQDYLVNRT